jgi:acetolactate synthase small subunit
MICSCALNLQLVEFEKLMAKATILLDKYEKTGDVTEQVERQFNALTDAFEALQKVHGKHMERTKEYAQNMLELAKNRQLNAGYSTNKRKNVASTKKTGPKTKKAKKKNLKI